MQMERANGLFLLHHEERCNRPWTADIHLAQSLHGKRAWRNRPGITGHDLADPTGEKVAAHMAAEIAVGENSDELSRTIDNARHSPNACRSSR